MLTHKYKIKVKWFTDDSMLIWVQPDDEAFEINPLFALFIYLFTKFDECQSHDDQMSNLTKFNFNWRYYSILAVLGC